MEEQIVRPREWIGGLLIKYSPEKREVKYAMQNMGIRIEELEAEVKRYRLKWQQALIALEKSQAEVERLRELAKKTLWEFEHDQIRVVGVWHVLKNIAAGDRREE